MKFFIATIVFVFGFSLGLLVMDNQWFPYAHLKTLKQAVSNKPYQPSQQEVKYYLRKVSVHQLALGQKFDAVFVGDSLIDEVDWSHLFPRPKIVNFGINGDTTAGLLKRMDTLRALNVSKVFVLIGVNDLLQGNLVENIEPNYVAILDDLGAKSSDIYILSLFPLGVKYQNLNADINRLNEFLRIQVRNYSNINYIDLNAELSREGVLNPLYSNDSIHLNGFGYSKVKRKLNTYFK